MEKVKGLRYDIKTGLMEEYEVEVELPNPRIQEIEQRLQAITQELKEQDYKTLKYIEGDLSEEEFITHKTHKNALREEYNTLEDELSSI